MKIDQNPLERFKGKESQEIGVYQRVIAKAEELAQAKLTPARAQEAITALAKINNSLGEKQWRQDFKSNPQIDNPEQQEIIWAKYLLINLGFDEITIGDNVEQTYELKEEGGNGDSPPQNSLA